MVFSFSSCSPLIFLLSIGALLISTVQSTKLPSIFRIHGQLTCRGNPTSGKMIMVDDNFFLDHLFSERKVYENGKFSMAGEPTDDNLEVVIFVVHKCHNMRMGRHDSDKIKMYSEFKVRLEDLEKSNWNLELDIELANNVVKMYYPGLHFWKTLLYGKRIYTDSVDRIKKLQIWNNT